LYNGTAPYPDFDTLRLSDAFAAVSSLIGGDETPCLELLVKVYNINNGHNEAILEKCGVLKGYSVFVEQVREHRKKIPDKELAFREAVKYCLGHGILSDFLARHSTEVFNMLLTEWNTEEWGEVCREEGRNTVLDLVRQGYTVEQIEARLAGQEQQVQQTP
jgi:hypothetical protein